MADDLASHLMASGAPPQRMLAAQWDMIARKRMAGVPLTPEEEQAVAAGEAYKEQVGEPKALEAVGSIAQMALPPSVVAAQMIASPTAANAGEAEMLSAGDVRPGTNEELWAEAMEGDARRAASPSLAQMLRQGIGNLFGGAANAQTRGGVEAEAVRALQTRLKESGHYTGPIDGVMGPATQAAQSAASQAQSASQAQIVEMEKARAAAAQATAAQAETDRLAKAAAEEAARKTAADARMKEIDDNTPTISKMLREYGPAAGALAGAGLGMFLRGKVVNAYNKAAKTAATRADDLMRGASTGTVPERVGKVNQFWAEGQRGRGVPAEPFRVTQSRHGYAANADVPTAASLYRPDRLNNAATDVVVPGMGIAESVIVDKTLGERARADLAAAQDAVGKDPSEANIQRLQDARNKVAVADAVSMAGRGAAIGYVGDMPIKRRAHVRPMTATAEAERMTLGQMLRSGQAPAAVPQAPVGPAAPAAPPAAPAHPAAAQPRIPAGQPNAGRWTRREP